MMCPPRVALIRSTMQASVVLLPLPAGPVTRIMPSRRSVSSITSFGMPSASGFGRPNATTRHVAASEPRCRYALQRTGSAAPAKRKNRRRRPRPAPRGCGCPPDGTPRRSAARCRRASAALPKGRPARRRLRRRRRAGNEEYVRPFSSSVRISRSISFKPFPLPPPRRGQPPRGSIRPPSKDGGAGNPRRSGNRTRFDGRKPNNGDAKPRPAGNRTRLDERKQTTAAARNSAPPQQAAAHTPNRARRPSNFQAAARRAASALLIHSTSPPSGAVRSRLRAVFLPRARIPSPRRSRPPRPRQTTRPAPSASPAHSTVPAVRRCSLQTARGVSPAGTNPLAPP